MQNNLLTQARQNRLIATVRVFQACLALASALVEQNHPGAFNEDVRRLLVAYLGVSGLAWTGAQVWRGRHEPMFLGLLAVDGAVAATVLYLTAGVTGAFFALFLLVALSATLQWGWRGAAAAAGVALLGYGCTALPAYRDLSGFQLDPPRFALRAGAMLSIAGLLVAYGRHQERIVNGMLSLFGTQLQAEGSERPPTFNCLELAASVFGLERATFVWDQPEEPGVHVDQLAPEGRLERAWPVSAGEVGVQGLREPFFFDARGPTLVTLAHAGHMQRGPVDGLNSPLLESLAADLTLVLPVSASRFSGWILLSPFPSPDREALVLGGVVAAQASIAVQGWRSLVAWRDAAAAEERVRLARDLHDGTLQFMAGTAMQLASLSRELEPGQERPRERIQRLLEDLRSEQRQLRELIESTSSLGRPGHGSADFRQEIQNLTAVLARRWGAAVSVDIAQPADRQLPAALVFELLQIVREAISNAVRHGKASAVSIHAETDKASFRLTIADNGVGMPVQGVFDMQELKAMSAGPRMLLGRVAGLGGRLVVESQSSGTTLRITAPLGAALS
jgi:signal transduction histidine kinase